MRGSSCSAGSWWEIPATSAGNPARGDRCGTGSGGGGGAGTWRRRRRRRYVVTEAEHFLMGAKSRSLAAPAPSDARATTEEEDGGGGTCLRRFGNYEVFFCKIINELRARHVFRDGGSSCHSFPFICS
uniref:Uncharacterized protein n=1 Tax=Aegilops tauschii subsp. strangulata TaxID=200361 RepID=A0A452ZLV3_AEGTS